MNEPDSSKMAGRYSIEEKVQSPARIVSPESLPAESRQPEGRKDDERRPPIVLNVEAVEARLADRARTVVEAPSPFTTIEQPVSSPASKESEPQQILARMLNEFVYCQRLFYYEFVEGVFVESADTLRGEAIHQRVDSGSGALPKAKGKAEADKPKKRRSERRPQPNRRTKETETQERRT